MNESDYEIVLDEQFSLWHPLHLLHHVQVEPVFKTEKEN